MNVPTFVLACVFAAVALAQTSQPAWTKVEGGKQLLRAFEHAPYPHPSRAEGFKGKTESYPKAGHYDDSTVAIVIPDGYVPGETVDFVMYFHGHKAKLQNVLTKHRLAEQLAASKVNAILVAPQGPKDAADSGCGKLELDKGAAKALLQEIRTFLIADKKLMAGKIGWVALAAHSGGYKVTASILDHGGLDENVTDVLLLDASYGNLDWFANWCAGGKERRLVSLFTQHLADENKELMGLLAKAKVAYSVLDEKTLMEQSLRTRAPILVATSLAHNEVPVKTGYLERLLRTSALGVKTAP